MTYETLPQKLRALTAYWQAILYFATVFSTTVGVQAGRTKPTDMSILSGGPEASNVIGLV